MSRAGAAANRLRKIDITVVTPTIPGREQFLEEAKASVGRQTLKPVSHLIHLDEDYEGPGPTLNLLIPQAETEWVSILADDDLYLPHHLETLAANVASADIVMSWSRIQGRPNQYRGVFRKQDWLAKKDTGMRGCFLFRKSLYDQLGGWPEGEVEDWQFVTNAIHAGARIRPVYKETWIYRIHPGSTSELVAAWNRGERPAQMYHLLKGAAA